MIFLGFDHMPLTICSLKSFPGIANKLFKEEAEMKKDKELRSDELGFYWQHRQGQISQYFGRKTDALMAGKHGLIRWMPMILRPYSVKETEKEGEG